ncbi:hypothetical protein SHELI_v1c03990 [Spiroplasma helicoides]|uniref:Uncharacterized protein n=1 Tax=Spiroplasma helicoides TaxID=216938 RepID=A0A1B3SK97_9MOLU|nr:hypothetical protein SHELI_v1c03990 [Spiroplasma helicoides]
MELLEWLYLFWPRLSYYQEDLDKKILVKNIIFNYIFFSIIEYITWTIVVVFVAFDFFKLTTDSYLKWTMYCFIPAILSIIIQQTFIFNNSINKLKVHLYNENIKHKYWFCFFIFIAFFYNVVRYYNVEKECKILGYTIKFKKNTKRSIVV